MISKNELIVNMKLLDKYRVEDNSYIATLHYTWRHSYDLTSDKDKNKIISKYSFFKKNSFGVFFEYFLHSSNEYSVNIYSIEDDYYCVLICYKDKPYYNYCYYKLDQMCGLLKFLRILFKC